MNFYEDSSNATWIIQRATLSEMLINGEAYTQSLTLTERGLTPWPVQSPSELTVALLEPLTLNMPELVIIGTGAKMVMLPPALLQVFYQKSIGVEIMDTPAAARTYNLLASEGRALNAAFILSH